ncbi:glutamate--tRNA ligase [Flavobacterium franklandianum]|uniref:Glutamate--tRNA ligase n=1 Tax=Flavobacterium franklandianum TaxID=2594430 RepID=A0A553CTH9_9FLAO|nr:glutamate--tRNA ligase [Flavobacterium franklandianum]TRX23714.1 glutamate--tRNA ligase [Flavobacterium franklandianum]
MSKQVRVRFAPSPTGPLHIGGVRTALFNYLFAKKNNGVFFLRIEDTDQNRFVPGAEEYIMESLEWLGIAPDETIGKNEKFGPYKQSERKHLYLKYADDLINSGNAYYAFDTAEALDLHRKQHEEQGKTFIYNWHNREKLDTSLVISAEETAKRIAAGEEYVIRFKTPVDETLQLQDIIRGEVKFETNLLDDKVLFKSDGMPTYHLANIVDDHLMETSHVIRGEEWLPSMPLHVLLYRAFGWEAPQFAHLPLILKPVGNGKLSKRDGDKLGFPVFPLEWKTEDGISSGYREKGFFPETVINFLALLGWNDGTEQEIFTLEELVDKFDLNRVHKAGAKFDPEKNKWFNHQYLMKQSDSDLAEDFAPIVAEKGFSSFDCAQGDTLEMTKLEKIVSLIKERANFVSEFWDLSDFFFVAPTSYDEKARKNWKEETPALMQELISVLSEIADFTSVNIETIVKDWMTKNEIGMGKVMQPFRLSLVGALKGPHLFDIVELIGKEETIKRIETAIATL